MDFSTTAFNDGITKGVARLKENYTDFTLTEETLKYYDYGAFDDPTTNNIRNVIKEINVGETYLDRFITVYVEIMLVAQLVRRRNSEPALTNTELTESFLVLARILNSFVHK